VPAWSDEDAATGDYLLLVRDMPAPFVSEEREFEFQREIMSKRSGNTCEYAEDTAPEEASGSQEEGE
jgi:hypothetical protein